MLGAARPPEQTGKENHSFRYFETAMRGARRRPSSFLQASYGYRYLLLGGRGRGEVYDLRAGTTTHTGEPL